MLTRVVMCCIDLCCLMFRAALPSLPASLEELWCQDNNLTGAKGGAVVWSMRVLVLVANC